MGEDVGVHKSRNDAHLGRLGIGSARTRRHAVTQAEGDRNVMGKPHVEAIIRDVLRTVPRSEDVSQVRWRHRSLSALTHARFLRCGRCGARKAHTFGGPQGNPERKTSLRDIFA